jgi:hypothetical protein
VLTFLLTLFVGRGFVMSIVCAQLCRASFCVPPPPLPLLPLLPSQLQPRLQLQLQPDILL